MQVFDRGSFGLGGAFSTRFRPSERVASKDDKKEQPAANGGGPGSQMHGHQSSRSPSRGYTPTGNNTSAVASMPNGNLTGFSLPTVPSPYAIPDVTPTHQDAFHKSSGSLGKVRNLEVICGALSYVRRDSCFLGGRGERVVI